MKKTLGWCSKCKEKSIKVKVYSCLGVVKRLEYCINKGCGYIFELGEVSSEVVNSDRELMPSPQKETGVE